MQFRATVFLTTRNGANFLAAALGSLIAQWRPDLELLFIDDGSMDGSFECARALLAKAPEVSVTMIRHERSVGMALLDELVAHAQSDILIECDHDDIAMPGRINRIISAFDADPNCRLVTSNAVLLSPEGHPIGIYDASSPDAIVDDPAAYAGLRGSKTWLGATMAFHRSVLSAFPRIDPLFCPYGLDLVAPMRALLLGSHRYIAEPLVGWRQHSRNGHRDAGANAGGGAAAERHLAFELMTLGQRLRDITHIERTPTVSDELTSVTATCTNLILRSLDRWCRVRNAPDIEPIQDDFSFNAVPPMITLRSGLCIEGRDALSRLTRGWSGFHDAEERGDWIWTERTALLSLLMPIERRMRLQLCFTQGILDSAMRVTIVTNAGLPATAFVGADALCTEVDLDGSVCNGVAMVLIHVPEANRPDVLGLSIDRRLLGVQLVRLQVMEACEADNPDR